MLTANFNGISHTNNGIPLLHATKQDYFNHIQAGSVLFPNQGMVKNEIERPFQVECRASASEDLLREERSLNIMPTITSHHQSNPSMSLVGNGNLQQPPILGTIYIKQENLQAQKSYQDPESFLKKSRSTESSQNGENVNENEREKRQVPETNDIEDLTLHKVRFNHKRKNIINNERFIIPNAQNGNVSNDKSLDLMPREFEQPHLTSQDCCTVNISSTTANSTSENANSTSSEIENISENESSKDSSSSGAKENDRPPPDIVATMQNSPFSMLGQQQLNINIDISKKFPCSLCKEVLVTSHARRLHMKTHKQGNNLFKCYICRDFFHNKNDLKEHRNSHKANRPFKCQECEKSFMTEGLLKSHQKFHTDEKNFKCEVCDKLFHTKTDLKVHLRQHTKEKPYKCDKCDKAFAVSSTLKTHMRQHTGEKPYCCPLCTKTFRQSSHLHTHIRTHTGETPHICSVCGQGFSQSCHLKTHMVVHTGEKAYKCSHCNMSFAHKETCKIHERIHTGEKPEICSECGKQFVNPSSLRLHMKMHAGDKKFKCSLCDKAYITASFLSKHYAHVHAKIQKCHLCEECGKDFLLPSELVTHLRNVHKLKALYKCSYCGENFKMYHDLRVHERTNSCNA